jgi:hypothetical protein
MGFRMRLRVGFRFLVCRSRGRRRRRSWFLCRSRGRRGSRFSRRRSRRRRRRANRSNIHLLIVITSI